jgi:hypothetical protein
MNTQDKIDLLTVITKTQESHGLASGRGTAPVTVQIGYVGAGGVVCDNGILITDAPPTIVNEITGWIRKTNNDDPDALGIHATIYGGGLLVS